MDWADKHPYYSYVHRLFTDIDPNVTQTLAVNFFINAGLVGCPKEEELRKKYDCNIPWAILLDPTSACNLHCTGCWAAEYGNRLNLSYDEIDDIIRQGKELGIYMYIYTGGEPLVRKKDLIQLCEKHSDCVFLCFTNATLIDEAFANEIISFISVYLSWTFMGWHPIYTDRARHLRIRRHSPSSHAQFKGLRPFSSRAGAL